MSGPALSTKYGAIVAFIFLCCLQSVQASRIRRMQDADHHSVHGEGVHAVSVQEKAGDHHSVSDMGNHSANATLASPRVQELSNATAAKQVASERRDGSAAESLAVVDDHHEARVGVNASGHDQQARVGMKVSNSPDCEAPTIKAALKEKDLIIVEPKEGRAYVACERNRKLVQKISCHPSECEGDEWCYVENSCGGWFNGCEKLKEVKLKCPQRRPEEEFRRRGSKSGAPRGVAPSAALAAMVASATAAVALAM
uniref:PSI domain-containing protein n=1 Tax=Alexandrium andersonii TaxID=327968 RepID=A0A7S2DAU3_9DINO